MAVLVAVPGSQRFRVRFHAHTDHSIDQYHHLISSTYPTLNYKISQLEKLSTWVIEDLPQGAPVIPCTKVLKEKCGPDGEIESYCVRIVTGGQTG